MKTISIQRFQKTVLDWYKKYGRHSLPWRHTRNPYHILVSELMLQQTQVDRVIPRYKNFFKKFPTIQKLATAPRASVIREWQGLGYNRRALFLKRTAEKIISELNGKFPTTVPRLESLPGVGPYTARAISVFAWNMPEIFIETNIRRVFIHFFFPHKKSISDDDILPFIKKVLWKKDPRVWYSALMDYGAVVLRHIENPNKKSKHYMKQSTFEGSNRYARSHLLKYVIYKERATFQDIQKFFADDEHLKAYQTKDTLQKLLGIMEKEGFLYCKNGMWMVSPL